VTHDRVRIAADGRITPSGSDPKRTHFEYAGEYRVHAGPGGSLLWMRTAAHNGNGAGRVLMMGEILSRMTVVEVLNIVTTTNWRGELHVVGGRGTRVLTVDQGALKHAQTDLESERLGEQLIRAGLLSRPDLERHLPDKPKDRRLGQHLVERGLLDGEVLFKQLQRQAETIFCASLLVDTGHYWFVAPSDASPTPATTVHLSLHALLMEGVQQLDEMALFRERIPHNRLFPSASDTHPSRTSLDASALSLLALCDGTRSIDELARATSLGEFPTLKIIYGLLGTGHVRLLSGPTLDVKAAERLVRLFNDVMRDIFLAVATYGSVDHVRRTINAWIVHSPLSALLGNEVDIDGTLVLAALLRRLEDHGQADPLQALHQALHELIAYALFTVTNTLPRHEELSLSREVNHRLKQLKL
jgi:Domain of unknown function (DUF4388)